MTVQIRIGDQYQNWTIIGERMPGGMFLCRCKCGAEKLVQIKNLRSGMSRQCITCARSVPDNIWNMPPDLYARLSSMARSAIRRCTNAAYRQWKDYGGRGISVYRPWIDDYREFVLYLSQLPGVEDESLVLDRTNNDGNYEPGNLRFVTRVESTRNRRCSRRHF